MRCASGPAESFACFSRFKLLYGDCGQNGIFNQMGLALSYFEAVVGAIVSQCLDDVRVLKSSFVFSRRSKRPSWGFVEQMGWRAFFPSPGRIYPTGLVPRYAKSSVPFEDGDTDLDLCDLRVEVSCHEALPLRFHTMHLGFETASLVIPAPPLPDGAAEI